MCGHKEICKILIEHGADLLALNSDGYMPYDLCDDAITLDYIESQMYSRGITQTVIDQMRCQPERQMLTDLKHLVERNSSRSLKSIRALLSNRNDEGATPLHIASANGYSTVIILLHTGVNNLSYGDISIAIRISEHRRILFTCCFSSSSYLAQLIQAGADIYETLPDGRSAVDLCDDQDIRTSMITRQDEYVRKQIQMTSTLVQSNHSSNSLVPSNTSLLPMMF
jgi:protein phosphatase 1 regulatory subunit 16A